MLVCLYFLIFCTLSSWEHISTIKHLSGALSTFQTLICYVDVSKEVESVILLLPFFLLKYLQNQALD